MFWYRSPIDQSAESIYYLLQELTKRSRDPLSVSMAIQLSPAPAHASSAPTRLSALDGAAAAGAAAAEQPMPCHTCRP
jgi:hypothetical protein